MIPRRASVKMVQELLRPDRLWVLSSLGANWAWSSETEEHIVRPLVGFHFWRLVLSMPPPPIVVEVRVKNVPRLVVAMPSHCRVRAGPRVVTSSWVTSYRLPSTESNRVSRRPGSFFRAIWSGWSTQRWGRRNKLSSCDIWNKELGGLKGAPRRDFRA